MSDHIAHIGICDDTFRLAAVHSDILPTFKTLMDKQREMAHMGSVTRSADTWSVELITWARQQLEAAPEGNEKRWREKLAFVLGSLTHRSADRLTKPITNCWRGQPDSGRAGDAANESKIMQDVFVWREVFNQGHDRDGATAWPFSPEVLAQPSGSAAETEKIYRLLLRRALIAMHTLNPDKQNIQSWLDGFIDGMQTYPKSLEQYAKLAAEWDPMLVKRYLTDKRFYVAEDALIQLARAAQHGRAITEAQVREAMSATDKTHSRYARALAKAMEYLIAAGECFEGRITPEQAAKRLDIGVPELSIQD